MTHEFYFEVSGCMTSAVSFRRHHTKQHIQDQSFEIPFYRFMQVHYNDLLLAFWEGKFNHLYVANES